MKKILLLLLFTIITMPLFSAITVDTTTSGSLSGVTASWSHACSGSDRILIVEAVCDANPSMSATYNSVAMTLAGTINYTGNIKASLWYMLDPPTGSHTVAITQGYWNDIVYGAVSYNGVAGIGNIGTAANSSNQISLGLTTTQINSWIVGTVGQDQTGSTFTPMANVITRWTQSSGTAIKGVGCDRPTTSTGSYTTGYTFTNSDSNVLVVMEIKEVVSGNTPTITPTIPPTTPTITPTVTPTVTPTITPTIPPSKINKAESIRGTNLIFEQ